MSNDFGQRTGQDNRRSLQCRQGFCFTVLWQIGIALSCAYASVAIAASNTLESVTWNALSNLQVELRLRTTAPAGEPLAFTVDKPARISLDLVDTTLGQAEKRQEFASGPVRSVFVAEAGGRTRVVLNLDTLVPYATRVEGNEIVVTVGGNLEAIMASKAGSGSAAAASSETAAVENGRLINSVDFRRGDDGSGRVVVSLSDSHTVVDVHQEGEQVIAEFKDSEISPELLKRLDVTDFATPVNTVDVLRADNNVRIVMTAGAEFEQVAYQSDDVFTVELKPYTAESEEALAAAEDKKEYTGERISLNFQDIETRAVLQLLADVSGLNVVVSDTVVGNVTLRLQNVPWDQALDIVLRTKGLDMRQHDNVVIVAPAAEIANRERQELEAMKQVSELAPLRSEFIQVNYAKASELAALMQAGGKSGLLSERGSVSVDERTNTLLVQDTIEKLTDIRRLIQRLDIPVRQVLIESRIVIVNDSFSRDIGVQTGFAYLDNAGSTLIGVTGTRTGAADLVTTTNTPAAGDRLTVNLPVSSGGETGSEAQRIAFAILDDNFLLDFELQALQQEGRGEIISTPRVITANQKTAHIEQGVEIPFQEASSSGATSTQFKKAVLSLEVTPLITPDNRIIMDLVVNKDSVGELVASATGGSVPSIDTREISTQVLVGDGETVVLGGIFETEGRDDVFKVPYLGDLPVVGALFRRHSVSDDKRELLIFVTPKILQDTKTGY